MASGRRTSHRRPRHMGISRGTVKNRLSNTYAKLGITSRAALKQFVLL